MTAKKMPPEGLGCKPLRVRLVIASAALSMGAHPHRLLKSMRCKSDAPLRQARDVAMWNVRQLRLACGRPSYPLIAKWFNVTHATALRGIRRIDVEGSWYPSDPPPGGQRIAA